MPKKKPTRTHPPTPAPFSGDVKDLGVKQLGSLFEAIEIAFRCAQLGPRLSLTARLEKLGVSKEYFYSRSKEYAAFTGGTDLTAEIEQLCEDRPDHLRHRRSDLYREYEAVRRWYQGIGSQRHDTPRVRLGVSPVLVRPLAARVLAEYRRQAAPPGPADVAVEVEYSRVLHQMFAEGRLDMFVTQAPPAGVGGHGRLSALTAWEFQFVCPHDHPAAGQAGGSGLWDRLKGTTLVLVAPHKDRSPQSDFHREHFIEQGVRVIEVATFERMHDLVACGCACITVPEFLEGDRLRDLSLIPLSDFPGLPPVAPLQLAVAHRCDEQNLTERKRDALRELAAKFEYGLRQLSGDRPAFVERLEKAGHFYYVRTREAMPGPARGASTAWAHGWLRLQVLRTGIVKGEHAVDAPRDGNGESRGDSQTFRVLGQVTKNPHRESEWHLVWWGTHDERGHNEEAYMASFVYDEQAESKGGDVVGVWTGRRTSEASDAKYQPSAGYMVLSLQSTGPELPSSPGEPVPAGVAGRVLSRVRSRVEAYRALYPGFDLDLPGGWEWQPLGAPDAPARRTPPAEELLASAFRPGGPVFDALVQALADRLPPGGDPAPPTGKR
ncbi:MAG: hypothetical protein K2V38_16845 [Gemmataceae bacterium]|nr:hypothetical protein [Gemmataceae bacterium]